MKALKLGWRHTRRVKDREVNESLQELQKYLTWPHVELTIDAAQAVPVAFTKLTLTEVSDPNSLLLSTDEISVPSGFGKYMFVGVASALIVYSGVGKYVLGWQLNGGAMTTQAVEVHAAAGPLVRAKVPIMRVVNDKDKLSVGASAPVATTVDTAQVVGFFLPLA